MAIRLGTTTPSKLYLGAAEVTKAYLGASEVYSSGPPAAWTPAELGANLALWLDADDASTITLNGATVAQWDDKSGNNFNFANATASGQPAYLATGLNSKPSLRTDGADTLFSGATSLGRNVSGLTAAIVGVHPVGAGFVANACDFYISNGVGNLSTRFALLVNPPLQTADRYSIAGRRLDADSYTGVPSSTNAVTNAGNPWIRIGQRAYSAGVANHWTNGTQDLTNGLVGTQGSGNTSDTASLRSNLFSNNSTTAGSAPANSELSEIVVTHSTMTTTDRQKLEGYLAHKWGLTANLPIAHPYKTTSPTV
jgi:hypothetical protein